MACKFLAILTCDLFVIVMFIFSLWSTAIWRGKLYDINYMLSLFCVYVCVYDRAVHDKTICFGDRNLDDIIAVKWMYMHCITVAW